MNSSEKPWRQHAQQCTKVESYANQLSERSNFSTEKSQTTPNQQARTIEPESAEIKKQMFSNSADPARVLNPKRGKLMQRCRRLRGYLRQSILLRSVTGLLERLRSAGSQHHSYERWIQLC